MVTKARQCLGCEALLPDVTHMKYGRSSDPVPGCPWSDPDFSMVTHEHQWGARINGLSECRVKGCRETDYDQYWGAGMFTDWPSRTTKGYGE